jgi:hypothetical protein
MDENEISQRYNTAIYNLKNDKLWKLHGDRCELSNVKTNPGKACT